MHQPRWLSVDGLHCATLRQLIADNLIDFEHLRCVHTARLGGSKQTAQLRAVGRADHARHHCFQLHATIHDANNADGVTCFMIDRYMRVRCRTAA